MNARYYDSESGLFISTDALYDTAKVKSLNPYNYSANNPTTFSDPSGLSPRSHMYSQSRTISALQAQNRQLIGHIKYLGTHIEQLQDIIRKQQNYINELHNRIAAMEAFIQQQAATIRRLETRVRALESVVYLQSREISRLRAKVAFQAALSAIRRVARGMLGTLRGMWTPSRVDTASRHRMVVGGSLGNTRILFRPAGGWGGLVDAVIGGVTNDPEKAAQGIAEIQDVGRATGDAMVGAALGSGLDTSQVEQVNGVAKTILNSCLHGAIGTGVGLGGTWGTMTWLEGSLTVGTRLTTQAAAISVGPYSVLYMCAAGYLTDNYMPAVK